MERFNQRVERVLNELSAEGVDHWTVALWDRAAAAGGRQGEGGGYRACNASKTRAAAAFLAAAARRRPEVILYGHVLLAPLAAAARVLSPRSRHVLFVHGHEVWLEPFRRRIPWRDRLVVGACIDEVASVSRLTAHRMAAGYGLPDFKFRLLPNAVDPPGAVPARRTGGRPPRLLTVARLSLKDRYKGCDRVLHALPRVLAEVPGARYDIVGDGPLRPELERLAGQLGVADAVRFLGFVDDGRLEEIYRQASLLVMPSTGEGFGIVFLEAWKHGLPVVAGNRDASREVVEDGVTGLCVDPESPAEIARAVVRLLADPDFAARLGTQGYRTLLERYTHEKFRDNLREILRRPAATGCGADRTGTT